MHLENSKSHLKQTRPFYNIHHLCRNILEYSIPILDPPKHSLKPFRILLKHSRIFRNFSKTPKIYSGSPIILLESSGCVYITLEQFQKILQYSVYTLEYSRVSNSYSKTIGILYKNLEFFFRKLQTASRTF